MAFNWLQNRTLKRFGLFARSALPDLIMVLMMAYAILKFLDPLRSLIDVQLFDESGYLYQGIRLLKDGLPAPADAPLYAIWYFILSLFQKDQIELYYLNYRLLTLFLPLAFYLVLRRYRLPLVPAGIITFFGTMISFGNLGVWPKVSHFTLLIILGSFFAASFVRNFASQLAVLSLGALLGSYARPELFPVYLLLVVFFLASLVLPWLRKTASRLSKSRIAGLLSWAVFSGACLLLIGVPTSGQARLNLAFAQHFSVHWVAWNGSNLNGFTDYPAIMQQAFGESAGPWQALTSRPALFFRHSFANLRSLMITFTYVFFKHAPVFVARWRQNLENFLLLRFTILALAYLVLAELLRLGKEHNYSWSGLRQIIQPGRFAARWLAGVKDIQALLLGCASYLLVAPFPLLIIWPEQHYVLLYGLVLILAVTLIAARRGGSPTWKQALLCGLVIAAATPPASALLDAPPALVTVNTIRFLRSLPVKQEVVMREGDGGYEYYLDYPVRRVRHDSKNQDFDAFMAQEKINMIVVSTSITEDHRYTDDPEWASFLLNYSQKGFIRQDVPDTKVWVLMKKDLLGPP